MASKTLKLPEVGIEVFVQTTCCWEEKIPETTHQCIYIYYLIYIYMYQLSEQSQQIRLTWTAAAPMLVAWHADKVPLVSRRRCPDYLSWKCRKLIAKLRLTHGDIADEIPFFTSMVLLLWMGYQAPIKAETPVKQSSPQVIEPWIQSGFQSLRTNSSLLRWIGWHRNIWKSFESWRILR